jgi:hypothetical protein
MVMTVTAAKCTNSAQVSMAVIPNADSKQVGRSLLLAMRIGKCKKVEYRVQINVVSSK